MGEKRDPRDVESGAERIGIVSGIGVCRIGDAERPILGQARIDGDLVDPRRDMSGFHARRRRQSYRPTLGSIGDAPQDMHALGCRLPTSDDLKFRTDRRIGMDPVGREHRH